MASKVRTGRCAAGVETQAAQPQNSATEIVRSLHFLPGARSDLHAVYRHWRRLASRQTRGQSEFGKTVRKQQKPCADAKCGKCIQAVQQVGAAARLLRLIREIGSLRADNQYGLRTTAAPCGPAHPAR